MRVRARGVPRLAGLLLLVFVPAAFAGPRDSPPPAEPPPDSQPALSAASREAPSAPAPTTQPAPDPSADGLEFRKFDFGDYEFSPGEGSNAPIPIIEEAAGARRGMFDIPLVTPSIESARLGLDQFYQWTGFRGAVAHTLLFQQATGNVPDRSACAGDLDFMTDWTVVGRGTPNVGRLVTTGEYRYRIGEAPPSTLGGNIGTVQNTTGGFNDRGWALRDLHYTQRLLDGRLIMLIGRADVSDYVGGHRMQGINTSFSNRNFSADATTAYPGGHVFTIGGSVRPIPEFYFTGGIANGYGTSTTSDLQFIDQGKFFGFGEFGFTPVIPGLGWGRYAFLLWHMPARDLLDLGSDGGFTFVAEQDLGKRLKAFGRYGRADDGALTGIKQAGQVGLGYSGLLGSPRNLTGAAVGLSEPANHRELELQYETVAEVFHRFQLTAHSQLTVGFQSIWQPARAEEPWAGVFTLRYRIAF